MLTLPLLIIVRSCRDRGTTGNMATPGSKQQGKELHQLKLTLTKYPRTTSVKVPTPTKQHPTKVGTVVSPTYQNSPPTKVLKLSDVLSLPVSDQVTSPTRTKTISTGISHQTSVVHPPTSKSPKQQHVLTMTSEPVTVKSPTRKRPIVVGSPTQVKQIRQQQQQLLSVNPVVAKSPKAKTMDGRKGELPSIKPKPPPLKLIVVEEETKKVPKHSKKSQSILPTSRVRTIMKTNIKSSTSDGPLNIGQDSVAVISKATVRSKNSCNTFLLVC